MRITIVLPLTRIWMLDEMADQIRKEYDPDYDITTLIVCDNHEIKVSQIQDSFQNLKHKIIFTGKTPAAEMNLDARRAAITNTFNTARQHVSHDDGYVWLIEDDTLFSEGTLKKLLKHITRNTGLVSGIQAGRHALKILGIWTANCPSNIRYKRDYPDPTEMQTLPYNPGDLTWVHATGLYCMLTHANLFKTTPFRYKHLGPDFYYGWDIYKKGYYNLADQTIQCGHKTQKGTVWPDHDCIETQWEVHDNQLMYKVLE